MADIPKGMQALCHKGAYKSLDLSFTTFLPLLLPLLGLFLQE